MKMNLINYKYKDPPETFSGNWDSKAPSIGTIFLYVETIVYVCKLYFLRNKTFLFFKEIWNFQHLFEKKFVMYHELSTHSVHSDNFHFHILLPFSDWGYLFCGFTKFSFKPISRVKMYECFNILGFKLYHLVHECFNI